MMQKKVVNRCDTGTAKGPTGCSRVRMLYGNHPMSQECKSLHCYSEQSFDTAVPEEEHPWGWVFSSLLRKVSKNVSAENCQLSTLPTAGG